MASYYSLSPPSSHHHNVDQDDVKSIDSQTTLQLDDFESDYDYDFDTTGSSVASGFVYLGGSPLQRMMPKRMSGRQVRSSFFSDGQYEEEEDEEEWYKNEEDEEEAVRRSESWEYVLGVLENQYSHESQYYDQGLHRHDHFRGFPFLSASGSKTFDVHDEIDHSSPSFGTARPHYDATASSGPTTPTNTTIIQYLSPSSPLARITSYLNQPDIRRDPWNISPPVEISPNPASANEDNEGGASHVFVRERFRAWNDPEPKGLLQVFEFVRQLLEGLIFFHEHSGTNIPFLASNIVMDTGLAPYPVDRSIFPVKYYLDSVEGVVFDEGNSGGEMGGAVHLVPFLEDVARLGGLIKELFQDLPDDPLSPLCNFMLSSPTGTKGGEPASDKAGVVSHAPVVAPSAKSALEVLQLLESGRI